MSRVHSRRRERGSTTVVALVLVTVCAAIAGSSLITNLGSQKEARSLLARERAFQAAEAGIDWALTKLRISKGVVPTPNTESVAVDPTATCAIVYRTGVTNGLDDNGNGVVDDAGEADYTSATATGISDGVRRTLRIVMKKAVSAPSFNAATYIDDPAPILNFNGNAFRIEGEEHLLSGALDATRPAKYGISSPAAPATLAAQIPAARRGNVTGLGGTPSIGVESHPDLATLMAAMRAAATVEVPPGTVTGGSWGTPTEAGVQVVHCGGDLHLSGGATGAGVLVVDGDLKITGSISWVGMILVGGSSTMTGGGSTKRVIGTLASNMEILTISGTIDLLYSSDAILLASKALSVPVLVSWSETRNP